VRWREVEVTTRQGGIASVVLAPLLDGPRRALYVAHRSSSAWQLREAATSGRVLACVLAPGSLWLPHGFVVPFELPVGAPASVSVGRGVLSIEGSEVGVARWWSPSAPRLAHLADRVDDRAVTHLLRDWRSRLGEGDGLTPYSDDVLCGSLVTLRAARHPRGAELAAAVDAVDLEAVTTATSAGLLRQAVHGRCIDALAGYLGSLIGDDERQHRCRAALEAVGHSSGRGMAEGVSRVLRVVVRPHVVGGRKGGVAA
jgi:uncharacterized protein DUF2877